MRWLPRSTALWVTAVLLLAVCTSVATARSVRATPLSLGNQTSAFGDLNVPEDAVVRGNVVCIGCNASVEGEVDGVVVVIWGDLELTNRASGPVVGVLSDLTVNGGGSGETVVNVLGTLESDGPIEGQVVDLGFGWRGLTGLLLWVRVLWLGVTFLLLVLLVAVAAPRIERMSEEVPVRYGDALAVGVVIYLLYLVVSFLLCFTLIGWLAAVVVFQAYKWLGIAAVFHSLVRSRFRVLGGESSVFGSVLLGFVAYSLILLVLSTLGWAGLLLSKVFVMLFFLAIDAPAIGLVWLTRAGTRRTSPPDEQPATTVVPAG